MTGSNETQKPSLKTEGDLDQITEQDLYIQLGKYHAVISGYGLFTDNRWAIGEKGKQELNEARKGLSTLAQQTLPKIVNGDFQSIRVNYSASENVFFIALVLPTDEQLVIPYGVPDVNGVFAESNF